MMRVQEAVSEHQRLERDESTDAAAEYPNATRWIRGVSEYVEKASLASMGTESAGACGDVFKP